MKKPNLIVILGPTATGKSDVAVQIAQAISKKTKDTSTGEVVSADSRQVYKGLNIGAGKITKKEMQGVRHHCLDIASPFSSRAFSVADFQRHATQVIEDIHARGNVPILCGGTGFYIQAIVDGLVLPETSPNPSLRKKLDTYSTEKLISLLKKLDPKRLETIDVQNRVRLIRAIEIAKDMGHVPELTKVEAYNAIMIGLDTDDELLKQKIYKRILARMKIGMVNEARRLHAKGLSFKRMRTFGLEYGLLADLLQKRLTKDEFIARLSTDIWHYVRRQRAWFKRDARIQWFDAKKPKVIVREVLSNNYLCIFN